MGVYVRFANDEEIYQATAGEWVVYIWNIQQLIPCIWAC